MDVEVVGVSGDTAETQALFKKAQKLNYTLLADFDGKVAKAFGVPAGKGGTIKKKIDGKEVSLKRGCTIKRWTFVIGKDGKIAHRDSKASAGKDSKNVIKAVKKLK